MRTNLCVLVIFFLFHNYTSKAQTSFKVDLQNSDPVKTTTNIALKEKIKIHEYYLKSAIAKKDLAKQLYGALYLLEDYFNAGNYVEYDRYSWWAENIAAESGNIVWQGNVKLRTGNKSAIVFHNINAAIKQYEKGLQLCLQAKDSFCTGESLGKIASLCSQSGNFKQAHYYFNLAIPILRKFSTDNLGDVYNEYASLLRFENRPEEALQYLDSAIVISHEKKDIRREMVYLHNTALAQAALGHHDKALYIIDTCRRVNEKNKWVDNLADNYSGMAAILEKKGKFHSALQFFKLFNTLNDSLKGENIKLKVAYLDAKFEPQSKEAELEKKQSVLLATERSLYKRNFLLCLILLLIVAGLLIWRMQTENSKKTLTQNKANLMEITKVLLEKNKRLNELEEKLASHSNEMGITDDTNGHNTNLYNLRILTVADWTYFKINFEKAHPGYLLRVRSYYPKISEAEERLFLFIKL